MITISLADAETQLSAYLDEAIHSGPIVIRRNGKAVGIMLAPLDEDDLERILLAYSPSFQTMLEKSRVNIREKKGIPHDEFWTKVEATTQKLTS